MKGTVFSKVKSSHESRCFRASGSLSVALQGDFFIPDCNIRPVRNGPGRVAPRDTLGPHSCTECRWGYSLILMVSRKRRGRLLRSRIQSLSLVLSRSLKTKGKYYEL